MYNDIASHWCGYSYDRLCWDGYTAKEVKTKGLSITVLVLAGLSSLEVRRSEDFHSSAFGLYSTKKTVCRFLCVVSFVHCRIKIANFVQVFCDFNVGFLYKS